MNCLRSRGRRDRGFQSHSGHGCFSVCVVCVFLCLCTGRGLATSWWPVQGVLPTVIDLVTEVKRKVSWRRPRPELGCRAKGKKIFSTRFHFVRMWNFCFKLPAAAIQYSRIPFPLVPCLQRINVLMKLYTLLTRVEAGSNTSTVTLRVVGGDEKGSLKSESVKYGHESQGIGPEKDHAGEGQQHI
jgi:hypothetical protein